MAQGPLYWVAQSVVATREIEGSILAAVRIAADNIIITGSERSGFPSERVLERW